MLLFFWNIYFISPCPGLPWCQPAEGSARGDRADLAPAQHVVHGRQRLRPRPLHPPRHLRVLWRGPPQQGLRASSKTVVDFVVVVSFSIHNMNFVNLYIIYVYMIKYNTKNLLTLSLPKSQ